MENASKALLIAGAVLLAILLISIGILVINETGSVTDEVGRTSKTMAIQTFNSSFISYEGKEITASQVKSLFNLIQSSNSNNGYGATPTDKASDKYVYLDDTEGNITNVSQISMNQKYSISITGYSSGGYVNVIKITANSSGGIDNNPQIPVAPSIPEEPPKVNNAPVLSVEAKNITENTATIVATGTDEDDDILNYTLSINNEIYGPSTKYTWDITGLSKMTTYPYSVKVTDGDKTVEVIGDLTTLKGNTAPVIVNNYNYSSSSQTTSFTIRMRATDVDGDSLTFKVYASTSQNGTYYEAGTATATSGAYKTITVSAINGTALTPYAVYWWYITVADSKETVTSGKQSLRTYCPGNTLSHDAIYCGNHRVDKTKPCEDCGGTGTFSCTGYTYYEDSRDTASGLMHYHENPSTGNYCPGTVTIVRYDCTNSLCSWYAYSYSCSSCSYYVGYSYKNPHTSDCGYCDDGIYSYTEWRDCPTHGYSSSHYYCNTHEYVGANSKCYYCSHSKTSPHND